jgi:hypothetical protein
MGDIMKRGPVKRLLWIQIVLFCVMANIPMAWGVGSRSDEWLAQTDKNTAESQGKRSSGKLILGPDLEIYIVFIEGQEYVLPEPAMGYVSGVPRDLTTEEAESNLIQFATFEAWNTWMRCLEAREKVKKKEMEEEQANLVCADADEKSAILTQVTALAMLENPFADPQEWENQLSQAEQKLIDAQIARENALAAGASLDFETAEGFTPFVGSDIDPLTAVPTQTTWLRNQDVPEVSPSAATR